MNEPIMKRWVTALRSGDYQQSRGALRSTTADDKELGNNFCCLGVLCDLYAKEHPNAAWVRGGDDDSTCWFDANTGPASADEEALPEAVRQWADMNDGLGRSKTEETVAKLQALLPDHKKKSWMTSLADINDDGVPFPQIADFIERNWQDF
jgi:hypothetical protein